MSDVRLELGSIGIISTCQKEVLEAYTSEHIFTRRKTYEEWYVNETTSEARLMIEDFFYLANHFQVKILPDSVLISGGI